jgi:acetyl esterase
MTNSADDNDVPEDLQELLTLERQLAARYAAAASIEEERAIRRSDAASVWAPGIAATLPRRDIVDGDVSLSIFSPAGAGPHPAIVMVHGGGWVYGSVETDLHLHKALVDAGVTSIGVRYRLAPEHRFPAGRDDVVRAYLWLIEHAVEIGVDTGRIAMCGGSAGANLVVSALLMLRKIGAPLPAAQLLFYGVYSCDFDTESYNRFGDGRFGLSRQSMRALFDHYTGGKEVDRPDIALLKADVAGLPPAWVGIAGLDVLRDDSRAFAAHLIRAGVPVECIEYDGLHHGFAVRAGHLKKAREAIASAIRFFDRYVRPVGG